MTEPPPVPPIDPAPGGPPAPQWGPGGWAVVLAALAVGFWQFPLRAVGTDFDHLPGDVIDGRLNNLILEHGYRYLTGADPAFWEVGMFHPARRIVAYSDAHVGTLPVYAAARAAGLDMEHAYQVWFLVPFGLNYLSAAWAVRRLGWGAIGSAAGGYVFAFGLPAVTLLCLHSQHGPRFLVPPALVLGWHWVWRPTTGRLALIAGCVVGQMYLTVYVGYFLAVVLALQAAVTAARYRRDLPWGELRRPGRAVWAGRGLVVLGATAAMVPLVVPYARATADHGTFGLEYNRRFHPEPGSWLIPAEVSAHRRELGDLVQTLVEGWSEKQLFPGVLPILAVAVGAGVFAARPGPRNRLAAAGVGAVTAAAGGLAVTDVAGVSLHDALYLVPGVAGMRSTGRIVLVLAFPLGLATPAGVETTAALAARYGTSAGRLVAAALLALLVADQRLVGADEGAWVQVRFPAAESVARRDRLAEVIRRHPRPTLVYVFPPAGGDLTGWYRTQMDAAAAAQAVGVPTVNGWSGYTPTRWDYFTDHTGLWRWLVEVNRVPEADLDGLVVIGEPLTPGDPAVEAELRRRFPPVPRP